MGNEWVFFAYDPRLALILIGASALIVLLMDLRLAQLLLSGRNGFSILPIPLILLFGNLCVVIRTKTTVFCHLENPFAGRLLDAFVLVCIFVPLSLSEYMVARVVAKIRRRGNSPKS